MQSGPAQSRQQNGNKISKYAGDCTIVGEPPIKREDEFFAEFFVVYMRGEGRSYDPLLTDILDDLAKENAERTCRESFGALGESYLNPVNDGCTIF